MSYKVGMIYTYKLSSDILNKIQQLAVRREAIELINPPESTIRLIRSQSLLRSALFSARIEGNPLTETEALGGKSHHNLEVQQLLQAYEWLMEQAVLPLTLKVLKQLHYISMLNLDETPGQLRKEQTAIFNMAGVAVYVPPPASEVSLRLSQLIDWLQKSKDPVPVKAAAAQYEFEKIHPFIDGNGRVGRLLSATILTTGGFGFRGMISVEKEVEAHRDEYYTLLSQGNKNITPFIDFYLDCLLKTTKDLVEKLKNSQKMGPEDKLLPRQREVYLIIKDHPEVSFDFLHRRFLAIPRSTLHYDLNQLIKKQLVVKLGTTRGVLYRIGS